MKILEINKKQGLFLSKEGEYKNITLINKEDIYFLLNTIYIEEIIEFDKCTEENEIVNPANKIIYERIYEKFSLFLDDKSRMKSEIDTTFKEFLSVYHNELENTSE